jgi:hypothetical protein
MRFHNGNFLLCTCVSSIANRLKGSSSIKPYGVKAMKTQAMGWLIAGVLAAGLNASYHDGGLQWAHELADRVEHGSAAVVALASGNAERFLAEAQLVSAKNETASCRLSTALARVQARLARSESRFFRFDGMTARQDAQLAWLDANSDRIHAQVDAIHIPAVAFRPVVVGMSDIPACPRIHLNTIHVNVPRTPSVHISVPRIDLESDDVESSNDPI